MKRPEHPDGPPEGPEQEPERRGPRLSPEERQRRSDHMKRVNAARRNRGAAGVGYNHFLLKLDAILKDEHRADYERMLAVPSFTGERALAWLRERGYSVGIDAVRNHKREFARTLVGLRHAARFADALGKLSEKHGPGHLADVTLTRVQQIVMQKLFEMCGDATAPGEENKQVIKTDELADLAKVVTSAVSARRRVEEMREGFNRRMREAAEEAKKAAKQGDSGTAVADRVREMLGLPLWDSDEDWKYGVPEYEMETFEDFVTGERKDIDGRVLSPDEYDEKPPHRLKFRKPQYAPPKGIEPLNPPVPHPRSKKQLAAIPPVDRPIGQAIWEAKQAKKAQEQAKEDQKQLPAPQDAETPAAPQAKEDQKQLPAPRDAETPAAPPAPPSPPPRPSGSSLRGVPGCR